MKTFWLLWIRYCQQSGEGNLEVFPPILKTHSKQKHHPRVVASQMQNVQLYFPLVTSGKYDWIRGLHMRVTSGCNVVTPGSAFHLLHDDFLLQPWRWSLQIPSHRQFTFNGLHVIISPFMKSEIYLRRSRFRHQRRYICTHSGLLL
jgi:hypothetical protein